MAEETKIEDKKNWSDSLLSKDDRKDYLFVRTRIKELQESRTEDHYGYKLESIWADADRDYTPHRLKTKGRRVIAEDEDKGWRGTLVTLGSSDWQSDISLPNVFIKIQTALSILIDRNPTGVFSAGAKRFQATSTLISQLYKRSWEIAKSKMQMKLFTFNLAKYGWAIARTYPLKITRKVKVIKEYNEDEPDKTTYEDKEIIEFNDLFRENLDPWNAWIDDMARPNNPFSLRDWCWRKVYSYDVAEEEFEKYPNWKYVKPGGVTTEKITGAKGPKKTLKNKKLVEAYFYESRLKDLFMVIVNDVPVIIEPLPISDATGVKKLSCWQAHWNLRHGESPYGIGIYEAIRYDQAMLDRIRNMTNDQLALSIYKMFFYQGTNALTDTGDIKIAPGVGKQVLDAKNINWLQVPGPGAEAWKGIELYQKDVDKDSGITDTLMGEVTGKTAFEIAQSKEAALARLKTPLDNICDALETEAYITISLIQMVYSIPETHEITDETLINDYLKEIQSDSDLYERGKGGSFTAKVYREFPLNLEQDEKDNLIETSETQFFRVKPKFLRWEGVINVKPQSILTPSKQLDKALALEMYNMLIPLLANTAQERMMMMQGGQQPDFNNLTNGKILKDIIKLYDKDPRDILPDSWLQEAQQQQTQQVKQAQPLIIPGGQGGQPQPQGQPGMPPQAPQGPQQAPKMTSAPTLPSNPQGVAGKMVSKMSTPLRK